MMKGGATALVLLVSGCGTVPPVPWARGPEVSDPACSASCDAHYEQCPQVFANFPERAAVECPAEHNQCLKVCESAEKSAPPPASPGRSAGSKEARLRELKHFYDEGLVTDDVYRDRQKAILAEP